MDNLDRLPKLDVEGVARLVFGHMARYKLPWLAARKAAFTAKMHVRFFSVKDNKWYDLGVRDCPETPVAPILDGITAKAKFLNIPNVSVRIKMNDAEHEVANY